MITIDNYFSEISKVDMAALPEALKKSHKFTVKATDNGQQWDGYRSSPTIQNTVNLYLEKLNAFIGSQSEKKAPPSKTPKMTDEKKKSPKPPPVPSSAPNVGTTAWVERIPDELKFIRRFVNMHGKTKTKDDILRFLNSLQKAIVERRIRKSSEFAEQVVFIQNKLIEIYNSMKTKITIELKLETFGALKALTGGQKVMASINFIKRYIALNGKTGVKDKAGLLLSQINRAMEKGKMADSDPYIIQLHEIKKHLRAFTGNKSVRTLEIEKVTLNGLEGILGCQCDSLNGIPTSPAIMNSIDFANMEFTTIGLKGKWRDLIGDPSTNFTAMVYGKPKMGKSFLCIDFAGYLARHHGKVLYVAKEEGLDLTLQEKLHHKNVQHPNLFVASILPADLRPYNFVFLDSVNKMQMTPDDITRLKTRNRDKSFIFIFQTTKDGNFRGSNSFQHDVDIVIEVPQKGKAVQNGRFNQGGEIDIFQHSNAA